VLAAKTLELPLRAQDDVVMLRHAARKLSIEIGLNLVDQTKFVTAASELARNTVVHGGGGRATLEKLEEPSRKGIRITFEDQGPGIRDLAQAMTDGFTSGGGLGLGLGGAKRLSSEFSIDSTVGVGTRVTIVRWSR